MEESIKYTKAIVAFVAVFAVFLVCMDFFLVSKEQERHYAEFNDQAKNELSLIGTFVTDPLLEQQFAVVEQFILQWGEEKPDIIEIKALSPDGFLLAIFRRSAPGNNPKTFRHSVHFMDQHLLDLEITKEFAPIALLDQDFLKHLIIQSLLVICVLGIILWFIVSRLALQPLEREIIRRKDAEKSLQKAHDHLETMVIERTSELASEKERLSVTLRSIGDGVITTSVEGEIIFINKMAEDLTGWKQEEVVGQPLEKVINIINEKTREPCGNPVTEVIKKGQIAGLTYHTVLIARDGTEKSIADSGAPIRDKGSKIVGVVWVFRDITDRLRMEKELVKIAKLESVGVLAGGIAHDFNNILAAILGNINLALFDADLKDATKELLSEAEKASLRAKDLTQQLLTFAKGGAPVKEAFSLEGVIKESASFVVHGEKVACRYDIPEDLWLADLDKGQISQVIQNIVLNASHAMPEGGIIKITCENLASLRTVLPFAKEGRFVKISIRDSGIGMPANVVEKIFDPYFSTKQEGSGLGLAISQSIINKHNGHISVESSPGVGTHFTIYLPASENTKIQKQKPFAENKAASLAKILIMDDEETVRTVAQRMLVELGYEVVLAAAGEEAVKLYQESMNSGKLFDLVIMDLTIPGGMGGKKAVQEVLNIDPQAKVIVCSGYSNDPIMASFNDFGFCAAIAKPYRLQELSSVIEQIID